jgi:hypothetical protein
MTTIVKSKTKETILRWSWKDYALLAYVREKANPDGTFHQTAARIADTFAVDETSIRRGLRDLVALRHLTEIRPRYKDGNGWWVPATYQVVKPEANDGVATLPNASRPHCQTPVVSKELIPQPITQPEANDGGPEANDALEAVQITTTDIDRDSISDKGSGLVVVRGNASGRDVIEIPKGTNLSRVPGDGTEYKRGAWIDSVGFDRERLPLCKQCGLKPVDYFPHRGRIQIEFFCDEECSVEYDEAQEPARGSDDSDNLQDRLRSVKQTVEKEEYEN